MPHNKKDWAFIVGSVIMLPSGILSAYNLYQHFTRSSAGMIELNGLAITMVVTGLFLCLIDSIDRKVNPSYLDDDDF